MCCNAARGCHAAYIWYVVKRFYRARSTIRTYVCTCVIVFLFDGAMGISDFGFFCSLGFVDRSPGSAVRHGVDFTRLGGAVKSARAMCGPLLHRQDSGRAPLCGLQRKVPTGISRWIPTITSAAQTSGVLAALLATSTRRDLYIQVGKLGDVASWRSRACFRALQRD